MIIPLHLAGTLVPLLPAGTLQRYQRLQLSRLSNPPPPPAITLPIRSCSLEQPLSVIPAGQAASVNTRAKKWLPQLNDNTYRRFAVTIDFTRPWLHTSKNTARCELQDIDPIRFLRVEHILLLCAFVAVGEVSRSACQCTPCPLTLLQAVQPTWTCPGLPATVSFDAHAGHLSKVRLRMQGPYIRRLVYAVTGPLIVNLTLGLLLSSPLIAHANARGSAEPVGVKSENR